MSSRIVRRKRPWRALALAASLLALASGCGSHFVARGSALYGDGRYVEAAEVFEQTEARLASSSDSDRARFGVYRGANFLKLGDVVHAARWLGYARGIVKEHRDALDDDDLTLLDASLRAIGSTGPAVPEHATDAVATAPSSPAAPTQ